MSIFTVLMLTAFLVAVFFCRDGLSAVLIVAFSVPFFAIPGLTDVLYLPVERNAPGWGGLLALAAGLFILWRAQEPWQLLLPMLLGSMMLWNAVRIVERSGTDTHAVGLEAIFYAGMLTGILSRWNDFGSFLPDPGALREAFAVWRSGF